MHTAQCKLLKSISERLKLSPRGCPVAVSVHAGNTADPQTLLPEITRLRQDFGLTRFVIVGDRGMIAQTGIDALCQQDAIAWITALKSGAIRTPGHEMPSVI